MFLFLYRQAYRKARLSTFTHALDSVYVFVYECLGDHFFRYVCKYIFQKIHHFLFHVIPAHSRPVESALPSFSLLPWSSFSLSTTLTYFTSVGVLLSPSHVRIATLRPTAITNLSVVPSSGMTKETWIPSVGMIKLLNKHKNKVINVETIKHVWVNCERDLHFIHHGDKSKSRLQNLVSIVCWYHWSNQYQASFTGLDYAIGQLELSFQVLFKAGPNIYYYYHHHHHHHHHHHQHCHHHFMVCTSFSHPVFFRTSHQCTEHWGSMQCEDGFHEEMSVVANLTPSHKPLDHLFWSWLFLTQLRAVPISPVFPTKIWKQGASRKYRKRNILYCSTWHYTDRKAVNQEIPAYASALHVATSWSENKCNLFHLVELFSTPFFCNFSIFKVQKGPYSHISGKHWCRPYQATVVYELSWYSIHFKIL